MDIQMYGRKIQRFQLKQTLILEPSIGWCIPLRDDFVPEKDEIVLNTGIFRIESVFIPDDDPEPSFNYVDEQAKDIKPEFTLKDLIYMEKKGTIEFLDNQPLNIIGGIK